MRKREKIYIVPTEYGFMYGAGIFVSLVGGAVYNNNLAFILCFFLVALFLIGMVQTHSNLKNIKLEKIKLFLSASESTGHGVLWLKSENTEGHSQLRVQAEMNGDKIDFPIEIIYKKSLHPQYFDFKTSTWGKKKIDKISISTRYPFGFFYVWRHFKVDETYYIYPAPRGNQSISEFQPEGQDEGVVQKNNGDDFSEHKKYEWGDSHRHIDWKAFARGRPLLAKKFEEGERQTFLVDYSQAKGDEEIRLRQMSKWIHECHDENISYAMNIRGKRVAASHGPQHKTECLKVLAQQRVVE